MLRLFASQTGALTLPFSILFQATIGSIEGERKERRETGSQKTWYNVKAPKKTSNSQRQEFGSLSPHTHIRTP